MQGGLIMDANDNYNMLSKEGKQLVEMYLVARQFKNAILEEEIIVLANGASCGNVVSWGTTKITFRGNQNLIRVFPFVVNKAFACEVYLKLLLTRQGFNFKSLKQSERHDLFVLFKNTNEDFKISFYSYFSSRLGAEVNADFLNREIEQISNVFIKWRYIYENIEEAKSVNYGFLNTFCEYLNELCQKMILEDFNYDVSKNMR